jgi:hypothetical protein
MSTVDATNQPFTFGLHGQQTVRARDFAQLAERWQEAVQRYRASMPFNEAVMAAREEVVEGQDNPHLAQLGVLLAMARHMALLQGQLDDDRGRLHHSRLGHEALVSLGHHYEALRYEACAYNHQLRAFIDEHVELVSHKQLVGWLGAAAQGRYEWAESEVSGAASEVALHAALSGLPELSEVRYASLEEDLRGFDFMAQWQGQLLTIDAKTGHYPALAQRKHGHRHLEVSCRARRCASLG